MANIGLDELVFLPSAAEIDQLERLPDIVGRAPAGGLGR
jgi:hypothetical protein